MSEPSLLPIRATLAGRWQVPTLLLGACLFAGGLIRIAAAHEPLTFEQELDRVRRLHEAGALTRANAYLLYLLEDSERPPAQRGELHRLLCRTIHRAEARFQKHKPENSRAIILNFNTAVRYGAVPAARDWIALADAYEWSDRREDAVDAFRQALRLKPPRADAIHRRLFDLQNTPGEPLSPAAWGELEAVLRDEDASPVNYRWALEETVRRLLARGETARATALVAEARKRLAGTAEMPALDYSEALCLERKGRLSEAEALLRSLRTHWGVHDELWGRAGWLLGRLQQRDGRPQAALSFYDDVLAAFQTGDLKDACELGRAECLLMLDRYERALEVFHQLSRRVRGPRKSGVLDRDAIRATMTTVGESRVQAGQAMLGIRFLEAALELVDESAARLRAPYLDRIAGVLVQIARETQGAAPSDEARRKAGSLFTRAAKTYEALADADPLDEDATTRALRLAADNYDAAGRTDEMMAVLLRFVREHPAHRDRAGALLRLGRALEAVGDLAGAAEAYETLIDDYPRWQEALAAEVPLARCLLNAGGAGAARGLKMLTDIVDDTGPDPLFTPQAQEYREALFLLARYYGRAGEQAVPGHFEKAITRLEDAIALYPDDPGIPGLRFLLAEAYRRSAEGIRENPEARADPDAEREVRHRLRRAFESYRAVKEALAGRDAASLTELERSYLRESYLYVADCLFDLGELARAIEAYREAAWRYENEPAAVSATMQVVHCYQRLGDAREAAAALSRLQWLLKKIPAAAFDARRGMSPKKYWVEMARRIERTAGY